MINNRSVGMLGLATAMMFMGGGMGMSGGRSFIYEYPRHTPESFKKLPKLSKKQKAKMKAKAANLAKESSKIMIGFDPANSDDITAQSVFVNGVLVSSKRL